MAVMMTMTASNGATVRIHGDCLAPGEEENRRRREAAQMELNRIYTEGALRRFREWREANPGRNAAEFIEGLGR